MMRPRIFLILTAFTTYGALTSGCTSVSIKSAALSSEGAGSIQQHSAANDTTPQFKKVMLASQKPTDVTPKSQEKNVAPTKKEQDKTNQPKQNIIDQAKPQKPKAKTRLSKPSAVIRAAAIARVPVGFVVPVVAKEAGQELSQTVLSSQSGIPGKLGQTTGASIGGALPGRPGSGQAGQGSLRDASANNIFNAAINPSAAICAELNRAGFATGRRPCQVNNGKRRHR